MLFKHAAARLRRRVFSLCLIAAVITVHAQDPAHSKGWVVIPVSEYGKLHERAFPIEAGQPPSSLTATLTRVDYELHVDGGLAAGRASLTLDVLQDGWAAVPVPSGLHIREALLDGKPATLVPAGRVTLQATAPGFNPTVGNLEHDAQRPEHYSFTLNVGSVSETVTVEASAASVQKDSGRIEREARKAAQAQENQPSTNVTSLQRRVAGVLPIAIDVPRTGASFQFVRPLVLNEETKLTFNYGTGKK